MIKIKQNLKGSSLLNTIIISIIIAIMLNSLLVLFYIYSLRNSQITSHKLFLKKCNDFLRVRVFKNDTILINSNGKYQIKNVKWGFFTVVNCLGENRLKENVEKSILIGDFVNTNKISLYESDRNKKLKLAGRASIFGNLYISKQGIDFLNINNIPFEGKIPYQSDFSISNESLPKPVFPLINFQSCEEISMNYLIENNINYNSFSEKTYLINIEKTKVLPAITLNGNFIIKSSDSIVIPSDSNYNDVIIIADIVNIESGFKGNLQIFAKKKIYVNNNVELLAPSVLCVNNDINEKIFIEIKENSKVLGAVTIFGNEKMYNKNRYLKIHKKAFIKGQVYCKGNIELKGVVSGRIHTNNFILKTQSTFYDNCILDGKIYNEENVLSIIENEKTKIKYIKEL